MLKRPKLSEAIRLYFKEALITVSVAATMLCVYWGLRICFGDTNSSREMASIQRTIASYPVIAPGKRLAVDGQHGGKFAYTFFVITSPTCEFCVRSAQFHRKLLSLACKKKVPLFVVVPSRKIARSFLSSSGLQEAEIIGFTSLDRRPRGVPAVVLVDSKGIILRVWLGELSQDEQMEVLAAVLDPASVPEPPPRKLDSGEAMLTQRDLQALSTSTSVTIISLEERVSFRREHPEDAINIPLEELSIRAASELMHGSVYAIDCSALNDIICSEALRSLRTLGFRASAADFSRQSN
jgi:hypothetical protein